MGLRVWLWKGRRGGRWEWERRRWDTFWGLVLVGFDGFVGVV